MPHDLPAVRILPMSDKQEGFVDLSIGDVQQRVFLRDLTRSGRYRYRHTGLAAPPGTIVLFQFKARIIASAIFLMDEKFKTPVGDFSGMLHLDPPTIRTFTPVDVYGMRNAWPGFRRFGHAKQALNAAGYPAFRRRLRNVEP